MDRIAAANAAHEAALNRYHDDPEGGIGVLTNEQHVKFGQTLWEVSYKLHPDDDNAALDSILDRVGTIAAIDPDMAVVAQALANLPHEQIKAMWAARWVDQACPRVVLDEKFAALLMTTDAGEDVADLVVAPWKSFLIEVPPDILMSVNPRTGEESSIRRIFAQQLVDSRGELVWNFIGECPDALQLWRHGLKTRDCLTYDDHQNTTDWSEASFTVPVETQDERVVLLIGRLLVSICLAMSDPNNVREQKRSKGRGKRWRLDKSAPDIRTFIVGRPVSLDCRPAIREFLHGKKSGGKVTVQFLVRGHWKRQAHGPGRSLRKLIHVEPYWKGPEEGKILSRSVHLAGGVENP